MHRFAFGLALLPALAIIVVGVLYVSKPSRATRSFGLPLPAGDADTAWWLRLKGVRDIASGLAVLAFMIRGAPGAVGLILLVEAVVPLGDMLVVLAAKGSARHAFGVHGLTALFMVAVAVPLTIGAA